MATIIPANQFRAPNVRLINYDTINSVSDEDTQLNFLKNIFRQYRGQTIEIGKSHLSKPTPDAPMRQIITDNQITEVPVSGFNSWWKIFIS